MPASFRLGWMVLFSLALGGALVPCSALQSDTPPLSAAARTVEGTDITEESGVVILPLGEVDLLDQETIAQTLKLTYRGDKPIAVRRLYNSCGCLRGDLLEERTSPESGSTRQTTAGETGIRALPAILRPGAEISLRLTVDLRQIAPGAFQKTLLVETTGAEEGSPSLPSLRIVVQGRVRPLVVFDPPQIVLVGMVAGRAHSQEFTLRPDPRLLALGEVPPLVVSTSLGMLGAEVSLAKLPAAARPTSGGVAERTPPTETPATFRYRLTVPADAPIAMLVGVLNFAPSPEWERKHPNAAAVWRQSALPCSGILAGDIMASPQTIVFSSPSALSKGEETADVRLIEQQPHALKNATIRTDTPALEATLHPGQNEETVLRLHLRRSLLSPSPSSPASAAQAQISSRLRVQRVTVTLKNGQRLVIPVQIFAPPDPAPPKKL